MTEFRRQKNRDARAAIAGYVYQVDLTIERWLNLEDDQVLELECGEDIDTVARSAKDDFRVLEQVKHRQKTLTLRTDEAVVAVANFIHHRKENPSQKLFFRYTTNALIGKKRPSPMSGKLPAIQVWEQIRQGENGQGFDLDEAVHAVRSILRRQQKPKGLYDAAWTDFRTFMSDADRDALVDLIKHFERGTGSGDDKQVSQRIHSSLMSTGHCSDPEIATEQHKRLFFHIFKLLTEPDVKRLTVQDREDQLALPPLSSQDRLLFKEVVCKLLEHETRIGWTWSKAMLGRSFMAHQDPGKPSWRFWPLAQSRRRLCGYAYVILRQLRLAEDWTRPL